MLKYKFLVVFVLLEILHQNGIYSCEQDKYPYYLHLSNSCGASILTSKYALTSAQCCETPGALKAFSGYARSQDDEEFDQERTVTQRILHPRYSNTGPDKSVDYCLLMVDLAFVMNRKTSIIALATKEDMTQLFNEMPIVHFFGYGGVGSISETKRLFTCLNVSIPHQTTCADQTATSEIVFNPDEQVCVLDKSSAGSLANVVDVGGPVVYKNLQFGVTSSWNASSKVIMISRVDYAYEWIDQYKTRHLVLKSREGSLPPSSLPSSASRIDSFIYFLISKYFKIHSY